MVVRRERRSLRETVTARVARALMGMHLELAAPPPATIMLPPAAAVGGNAERATSEDSKTMEPSDVKQLIESTNRVYNRRFRYAARRREPGKIKNDLLRPERPPTRGISLRGKPFFCPRLRRHQFVILFVVCVMIRRRRRDGRRSVAHAEFS